MSGLKRGVGSLERWGIVGRIEGIWEERVWVWGSIWSLKEIEVDGFDDYGFPW